MSDPNANRPGYKETKVGWIPEEWADGKVCEAVKRLEAGVSVNGEDITRRSHQMAVIKVSAVSYGVFKPDECKVIVEGEIQRARINPQKGNLLISRSNTDKLVGAVVFVSQDYPELFLSDKIWQTVAQPDSNMKWLGYNLASGKPRYTLTRLATGTSGSMKNITKEELLSLRIGIPPLPEQQKIAAILSTCDEVIEKMTELIRAKQRQKQALMQQLLTGKKRLPGFKGKWKTVKLGKLFKRVTRKNNNGCDNNLTISGPLGLINQEDYFNKRIAAKDVSNYFLLKRGEFAYNKSYSKGYPLGAIKMLTRYDEGVVSTLYICFGLKGGSAVSEFMRHFFESSVFNHELYKIAQEGARNHGLLNVSPDDFFNAHLTLPEKDEQLAISNVLEGASYQLKALEAKLSALKQQKKSLMQKLLTGQVRVTI